VVVPAEQVLHFFAEGHDFSQCQLSPQQHLLQSVVFLQNVALFLLTLSHNGSTMLKSSKNLRFSSLFLSATLKLCRHLRSCRPL
jgi:hypothetical protein